MEVLNTLANNVMCPFALLVVLLDKTGVLGKMCYRIKYRFNSRAKKLRLIVTEQQTSVTFECICKTTVDAEDTRKYV